MQMAYKRKTNGGGNKSGQASAVRVSETTHSHTGGVYAVDFAGCPEKLPRPILRIHSNPVVIHTAGRQTQQLIPIHRDQRTDKPRWPASTA